MVRETYLRWQSHDPTLRAGALTFFVMMPLPSLALIAIEFFALIYGRQSALQQLIHQITIIAGPDVASIFSDLLTNAKNPFTSLLGSLISIAFTLAGAIGAFSVLRKSIDAIWEIPPQHLSLAATVKKNLVPFILISFVGLIVAVWTVFYSVFFSLAVLILRPIFGVLTGLLLRGLQVVLSFGFGILLFSIIFKMLIETKIKWSDVLLAAVITSLVFTLLNYLFGVYLSYAHISTLAGTAGTLMLLFLWLYLTGLFLLFGAQFSRVYTERAGSISKLRRESEKERERPLEKVDVKVKLDWKVTPNPPEKPVSS